MENYSRQSRFLTDQEHFSNWVSANFIDSMRRYREITMLDHNRVSREQKVSELKVSELKVSKEIFSELKVKPDDVCSICHENYLDTDITIKCKECNNFFHDNCVHNWLTKSEKCSCPMCRTSIISTTSDIY